jgi:hypothetical protein
LQSPVPAEPHFPLTREKRPALRAEGLNISYASHVGSELGRTQVDTKPQHLLMKWGCSTNS